ncbi:MAG: redoxin domain-containing protein [Verrucomicrobia bacterium]|nr:redoxin domain-containing protein [Verrucomicrobiota bacterium]
MSQSPTDQVTPENSTLYRQGWKALNRLLHEDRSFSGGERNCVFLNCGGQSFADVSAITGFDFPDDARAVVATDWDFDGDLDLWTTARTAPRMRFLKNQSQSSANWIAFLLKGDGVRVNRDAIGARVELFLHGESIPRLRTVHAGDGFLSQSSLWVRFGFPPEQKIEKVIIHWPGAGSQVIGSDLSSRKHYILAQDQMPLLWNPPEQTHELSISKPRLADETATARIVLSGRLPLPPIYTQENEIETEIPTGQLKGPLLLNIWATWCAPCLTELSEWSEQAETIQSHGLRILSLNAEPKLHAAAQKILQKIQFPFQSSDASGRTVRNLDIFQQSCLDRWTAMPVPTSFLIDRFGRVAVIYKGPVKVDQILKDLNLLDASPEVTRDAAVPFPGLWIESPRRFNPLLVNSQFVAHNEIREGIKYLRQYAATAIDSGEASHTQLGDIFYVIGVVELDHGNIDMAQEAFLTALNYLPDDFRIQRDLAQLHMRQSQWTPAIQLLLKARATNSTDVEVNRTLGQAYWQRANARRDQGESQLAVSDYKMALSADRNLLNAANELSRLLLSVPDPSVRNPKEAYALAQQLCRLTQEKNPAYLDTLSEAAMAIPDWKAAADAAGKAIQIWESLNNEPQLQSARQRLQAIRNHMIESP